MIMIIIVIAVILMTSNMFNIYDCKNFLNQWFCQTFVKNVRIFEGFCLVISARQGDPA